MFVVAVTCSAIDSAQFTVTDQRKKQLSWCWHGIREQWQAGTSDWDSQTANYIGTYTQKMLYFGLLNLFCFYSKYLTGKTTTKPCAEALYFISISYTISYGVYSLHTMFQSFMELGLNCSPALLQFFFFPCFLYNMNYAECMIGLAGES